MKQVAVDFSTVTGKIKPMHAVNNGPAGGRTRKNASNYHLFSRREFLTREPTTPLPFTITVGSTLSTYIAFLRISTQTKTIRHLMTLR